MPVHRRKLKFVFEVGDRAQPADNNRQVIIPREINRQSAIAPDFDIVDARQCGASELDAFINRKHRGLGARIGCDRHHHPLEYSCSAPDKILADGAIIYPGAAEDYLDVSGDGSFDIVFLDPPFADDKLNELCRLINASGLLVSGANVYLEQDRARPEPALPDGWSVQKSKTAGNVRYMLVVSGHRN